MAANTLVLTDENFGTEVESYSGVVLVDFWAEWCGPCQMLAPVIEQLQGELSGKIKIGKLNIDNNTNTPAKYKVRAIPTLLIFKNGKVMEQLVGVQPKNTINQKIDEVLAAG